MHGSARAIAPGLGGQRVADFLRRFRGGHHAVARALGGAEVGVHAGAPVDQYARLHLAHQSLQPVGLPGLTRVIDQAKMGRVAAVEPEDVDFAVVRQQLAQLHLVDPHELRPALRVFLRAAKIARVLPVLDRKIQANLQPVSAARVHILAHKVAPGRGLRAAEAGRPGVEQAEAVVVLGGKDHVAHARAAGQARPLVRIEMPGAEAIGQRAVFFRRYRRGVHRPFAQALQGVQPPVNKQPESGLPEPLCIRHETPPIDRIETFL